MPTRWQAGRYLRSQPVAIERQLLEKLYRAGKRKRKRLSVLGSAGKKTLPGKKTVIVAAHCQVAAMATMTMMKHPTLTLLETLEMRRKTMTLSVEKMRRWKNEGIWIQRKTIVIEVMVKRVRKASSCCCAGSSQNDEVSMRRHQE